MNPPNLDKFILITRAVRKDETEVVAEICKSGRVNWKIENNEIPSLTIHEFADRLKKKQSLKIINQSFPCMDR
jgi:hypothetical protein